VGDGKTCVPTPAKAQELALAQSSKLDSATEAAIRQIGLDPNTVVGSGLDPKSVAAVVAQLGLVKDGQVVAAAPGSAAANAPNTLDALEEQRVKAEYRARANERNSRIEQLKARLNEYQALRKHRKLAEQHSTLSKLEKRVDSIGGAAAGLAQQKVKQLELLKALKELEVKQNKEIKELINDKSDIVLERAKEEARRLAAKARKPAKFVTDKPAPALKSLEGNQNYVDSAPLPKEEQHKMAPPVAVNHKDIPGAGQHTSSFEDSVRRLPTTGVFNDV